MFVISNFHDISRRVCKKPFTHNNFSGGRGDNRAFFLKFCQPYNVIKPIPITQIN